MTIVSIPTTNANPDVVANLTGVARTIRSQLPRLALMTVGADPKSFQPFYGVDTAGPHLEDGESLHMMGLQLTVRILPFDKDGNREDSAEIMTMTILLDPSDTYTVVVQYDRGNTTRVHARIRDVYFDEFERLLLALDWDGPAALNPRYWSSNRT